MCDRDRGDLALLAAGLLDEPAAAELAAHVRQCPECSAELASWQALATAVREEPARASRELPSLAPVLEAIETDPARQTDTGRRPLAVLAGGACWLGEFARARTQVLRPAARWSVPVGALMALLLVGAIGIAMLARQTSHSRAGISPQPSTGSEVAHGAGPGPTLAARAATPTVVVRGHGLVAVAGASGAAVDSDAADAVDSAAGSSGEPNRADVDGAPDSSGEGDASPARGERERVVVAVAPREPSEAREIPSEPTPPLPESTSRPVEPTSRPVEPTRRPVEPTSRPPESTAETPDRTPEGPSPSEVAPSATPLGPTGTPNGATATPSLRSPDPTRPPAVTGRVTGPDGLGRAEVWVVADLAAESGRSQVGMYTGATGEYSLELPAEGPWMLHVESPAYRLQWHSGHSSPFGADKLHVGIGSSLQPVDFPLEKLPDGLLTGRVARTDDSPIERAIVVAVPVADGAPEPAAVAFTYDDGTFALHLGPGDYVLGAAPDAQSWPDHWWEGSATSSDADAISLADGERIDGLAFILP